MLAIGSTLAISSDPRSNTEQRCQEHALQLVERIAKPRVPYVLLEAIFDTIYRPDGSRQRTIPSAAPQQPDVTPIL